jgi:hypothetical protein
VRCCVPFCSQVLPEHKIVLLMSPEPAGIIQVCADRSHAWRFGLRACCTHLSHRSSSLFLVLIISFIRPQDSLSSLQANTLDSPRSTPTQRCTNLLKLFVFASETRTSILVYDFVFDSNRERKTISIVLTELTPLPTDRPPRYVDIHLLQKKLTSCTAAR